MLMFPGYSASFQRINQMFVILSRILRGYSKTASEKQCKQLLIMIKYNYLLWPGSDRDLSITPEASCSWLACSWLEAGLQRRARLRVVVSFRGVYIIVWYGVVWHGTSSISKHCVVQSIR